MDIHENFKSITNHENEGYWNPCFICVRENVGWKCIFFTSCVAKTEINTKWYKIYEEFYRALVWNTWYKREPELDSKHDTILKTLWGENSSLNRSLNKRISKSPNCNRVILEILDKEDLFRIGGLSLEVVDWVSCFQTLSLFLWHSIGLILGVIQDVNNQLANSFLCAKQEDTSQTTKKNFIKRFGCMLDKCNDSQHLMQTTL